MTLIDLVFKFGKIRFSLPVSKTSVVSLKYDLGVAKRYIRTEKARSVS